MVTLFCVQCPRQAQLHSTHPREQPRWGQVWQKGAAQSGLPVGPLRAKGTPLNPNFSPSRDPIRIFHTTVEAAVWWD